MLYHIQTYYLSWKTLQNFVRWQHHIKRSLRNLKMLRLRGGWQEGDAHRHTKQHFDRSNHDGCSPLAAALLRVRRLLHLRSNSTDGRSPVLLVTPPLLLWRQYCAAAPERVYSGWFLGSAESAAPTILSPSRTLSMPSTRLCHHNYAAAVLSIRQNPSSSWCFISVTHRLPPNRPTIPDMLLTTEGAKEPGLPSHNQKVRNFKWLLCIMQPLYG